MTIYENIHQTVFSPVGDYLAYTHVYKQECIMRENVGEEAHYMTTHFIKNSCFLPALVDLLTYFKIKTVM